MGEEHSKTFGVPSCEAVKDAIGSLQRDLNTDNDIHYMSFDEKHHIIWVRDWLRRWLEQRLGANEPVGGELRIENEIKKI